MHQIKRSARVHAVGGSEEKKENIQTWSCFCVFLNEALLLLDPPLKSEALPMLLSPPLKRLSAEFPRLLRLMLMLPLLPIMSSRLLLSGEAAATTTAALWLSWVIISSRISSNAFSLDFWKFNGLGWDREQKDDKINRAKMKIGNKNDAAQNPTSWQQKINYELIS